MTFFDVALVLHGVAVGLAFLALFGYWGRALARPFGLGRFGMAAGALLGPVGVAIEYSIVEPYRHPPAADPFVEGGRARNGEGRPTRPTVGRIVEVLGQPGAEDVVSVQLVRPDDASTTRAA